MTHCTCPGCGAEMSLDVLIGHTQLRQAAAALVEKSLALGSLTMRYIGLFRPAKNRMSADRWARLIEQLIPDLQRNAITHKGREWHMPLQSWKLGLEAVLDRAASGKLTLPLENHGYLYATLAGMADQVESQAERDQEQTRRHHGRHEPNDIPGAVNQDRGFTSVEEVRAALRAKGAAA